MRIVSLVERWDGDVAGHAYDLAVALGARGHAVTLCALAEGGVPPAAAPGVTTVRRGWLRLVGSHDVVQLHVPLRAAAMVALCCRIRDVPVLASFHGAPRPLRASRASAAATALAMRLATWVTADADDQAEHAVPMLDAADRSTCIVPPTASPVAAARPPGDAPLVAVAGPDAAAEVAAILRTAAPSARVVDAIATPAAAVVGDVLVVPSSDVAVPRALVQALRAGTPVVAVDVPGARDLVRAAPHRRLVRPDDDAALADAIRTMLAVRERAVPPALAERLDAAGSTAAYERLFARLVRREPQARRTHVGTGARSSAGAASLDADDEARLESLLANEMDMAYRRRARILLDWLELADGLRVLDSGCGMGFYLLAMGRLRRLRLVGLDVDPGRTAWARSEGVPAGLVRGDFEELPFAGSAFDRVLMSETLEHVADDRRALRELHRVLAPGGVAALSVPHVRYPFWWDPIHRAWTATGGAPIRTGPVVGMWSNHERLYTPEALADRLRDAGFVVERVEESTHYTVPFAHFLVYGIGKPLIEHGLLPERLRRSADRMRGEENTGTRWNALNAVRALFRAVDRLNERAEVAGRRTFVNVLVKARKPA